MRKWVFLVFLPVMAWGQSKELFTIDTTATTTWRARGKSATFVVPITHLSIITYGTSLVDTLWLAFGSDTASTKNSAGTGKLISIIPGETGAYSEDVYITKWWVKYTGTTAINYQAIMR